MPEETSRQAAACQDEASLIGDSQVTSGVANAGDAASSIAADTTLARGAFWVAPRDRADGLKDIHFILKAQDVPHDQLTLKSEIERSQSALLVLYAKAQARYDEAFAKLLSLAQVGLVGQKANPAVAREALASLQREIVDREGGQVKNAYLRRLGAWAIGIWAALSLLYVCSSLLGFGLDHNNSAICMLVSGSPIGTWLSFASRKVQITFFELSQIEDDRLDPSIRLVFVALLTLTFGLLVFTGMLNVEVGNFSAANFVNSPHAAFLLGILLGLAEKVLPARVLDQATALLAKAP